MAFFKCRRGSVLWMKRLEKARFKWPLMLNLDIVELNAQQINWLLDGYDLTLMQGHVFLPHHTGKTLSVFQWNRHHQNSAL